MTLVTEKEAAEKWCPMVHVAMATIGAETRRISNRGDDHEMMVCVGSRCMAFRWHDEAERVQYETQSVLKKPGETNPPFSNLPDGFEVASHGLSYFHCRKETSREPRRGFCGAFGKVEP